VGLAEWWADLKNLHPQIFLNFYIIQCVFNVRCSFTSQSECVTTVSWALWSQWACHMSIRLLRHYGGRWPAWLVSPWRLGETTRQQARKLHTGWLRSAWSQCWGQSTHCCSDHVTSWPVITEGATRHHHCVAVSRCINTINDRRLLYSRHAGLQPCMFGCSGGYILPKPGCWFHYYAANEAWIRGPPTSAKKLADLSPRLTADRSSLAVLIGCPS